MLLTSHVLLDGDYYMNIFKKEIIMSYSKALMWIKLTSASVICSIAIVIITVMH
jgi:hypothetical protein